MSTTKTTTKTDNNMTVELFPNDVLKYIYNTTNDNILNGFTLNSLSSDSVSMLCIDTIYEYNNKYMNIQKNNKSYIYTVENTDDFRDDLTKTTKKEYYTSHKEIDGIVETENYNFLVGSDKTDTPFEFASDYFNKIIIYDCNKFKKEICNLSKITNFIRFATDNKLGFSYHYNTTYLDNTTNKYNGFEIHYNSTTDYTVDKVNLYQQSYDIKRIYDFLKCFTKKIEKLTLYYSEDKPLLIEFEYEGYNIRWIIAPRIE